MVHFLATAVGMFLYDNRVFRNTQSWQYCHEGLSKIFQQQKNKTNTNTKNKKKQQSIALRDLIQQSLYCQSSNVNAKTRS